MSSALVTGAASGIGRAVAQTLAARGHRVVLADMDETALQRAAGELRRRGADCIAQALDVRDAGACRAVAAEAAAGEGGLRLVGHCAGVVAGDAAAADLDAAAWERILGVNLTGTFNVVSAALPHLLAAGGGALVMVSSIAALQGRRRLAAYSASKAGILGLARSLAADYAAAGVRVNCVCPGPTETAMTASLSRRPPSNAHGHMATPQHIAAAVAWLLSDEAAWVNGAVLPVDDAESGVFAGAFYRRPPA